MSSTMRDKRGLRFERNRSARSVLSDELSQKGKQAMDRLT